MTVTFRGLRTLRRVRTWNVNAAKKHKRRLSTALFSTCLLTLVLPQVAGATTAGWSSGSWSGSPTESYLYAAQGLIQATGESCTQGGSVDSTFPGGAGATLNTGRALLPFAFLTSLYWAQANCGYGGTAAQWGGLQATWLAD